MLFVVLITCCVPFCVVYLMMYCRMSPLGSLGGIQFSSIPLSNTLVIVRCLGGDGAVM